jgi:hypothetical protein
MKRFNWRLTALVVLAGIATWYLFLKRKTERLYGVLLAEHDHDQTETKMRQTGLYMTREAIYFFQETHNNNIDRFLQEGVMVQINFNYKPTSTPVLFPTDTVMIRRKAEEFFSYYAPYKDKIIVVCENEWDNGHYREEIILEDYFEELKIVVEVGHKYGFKVADAAITGNNLQRWAWSQLRGEMRDWWSDNYFIGKDNEYWRMVALVTKYARGIREIPIDYINTHWYNKSDCYDGYPLAVMLYKRIIGKPNLPLINNEWGIKTNDKALFDATKREIEKAGAKILVAYSGVNAEGKAVQLTDEMLEELH